MTHVTIADLTADRVVYRDLIPCDPNLPGRTTLLRDLSLPETLKPRKREMAYAQILAALAQIVQHQRHGADLQTLLVIGDTENDRQLTLNLQRLPGLHAVGFIGVDDPESPAQITETGGLTHANRWRLIDTWMHQLEQNGIDWKRSAVLIDIDKTLLGPRGRSGEAIDAARSEGALQVAHELLGTSIDIAAFQNFYTDVCRSEWHPLTTDNQDYVVLIALMALSGTLDLAHLRSKIASERIPTMTELLETAIQQDVPLLNALFREMQHLIAAGDPTPFKQFRQAELDATVARMRNGSLPLCREVYTAAATMIERGAVCMAASDKPAESAIPAQDAIDPTPLHHTPAHLDDGSYTKDVHDAA
jgi:hypothetical protein